VAKHLAERIAGQRIDAHHPAGQFVGCQSVPGELPEFVDGRTGQALDRYYERHDLLAPLLRHGSGDGDLGDGRVADGVAFYVSTGRDIYHEVELRGWADRLADAGVTVVTDTCTYFTPIIEDLGGTAMTDSAKWAYYAPGNLGVEVVFGSVEDCVASAMTGRVVRDESIWADA